MGEGQLPSGAALAVTSSNRAILSFKGRGTRVLSSCLHSIIEVGSVCVTYLRGHVLWLPHVRIKFKTQALCTVACSTYLYSCPCCTLVALLTDTCGPLLSAKTFHAGFFFH